MDGSNSPELILSFVLKCGSQRDEMGAPPNNDTKISQTHRVLVPPQTLHLSEQMKFGQRRISLQVKLGHAGIPTQITGAVDTAVESSWVKVRPKACIPSDGNGLDKGMIGGIRTIGLNV